MEKQRRLKNILIVVLVIVLLNMTVIFAVFRQELKVSGVTKVLPQGTFDIAFTSISPMNVTGYATGSRSRDETEKNITFTCEFVAYGDSCSFSADLTNRGTIDAKFTGFEYSISENGADVYTGSDLSFVDETITIDFTKNFDVDDVIQEGESKNISISVVLNPDAYAAATDNYTIQVKYNFEQVT